MLLPLWPPVHGLTTNTVPLNETLLSIHARTHISAPASVIWDTLRNSRAYPDWNNFTPSVHILRQPHPVPLNATSYLHNGTTFQFTVMLDPKKANESIQQSEERVTDISTPAHQSSYISRAVLDSNLGFYPNLGSVWRISWAVVLPPEAGLKAERVSEIIELGAVQGRNQGCEYRTWENLGGEGAKRVKRLYEWVLNERFAAWSQGLKEETESRAQQMDGVGRSDATDSGGEEEGVGVAAGGDDDGNAEEGGQRGGNSGDVVPGARGFTGP